VEGQHGATLVAVDGGEGDGEHVAGAAAGPGQRAGELELAAAGDAALDERLELPGVGGEAHQQGREGLPAELCEAGPEQRLGHRVDEQDVAAAIHRDHPVGDRAQGGVGLVAGPAQAAAGVDVAQHQGQQMPAQDAPAAAAGGSQSCASRSSRPLAANGSSSPPAARGSG
jgi:hypothetical protein